MKFTSSILIAAILASGSLLSSCGNVKSGDDDRTVIIKNNAPASQTEEQKMQESVSGIVEFYKLYASKKGATPEELANVINKFKAQVTRSLGLPADTDAKTIVQLLLLVFPKAVDGLTPEKILAQLQASLPVYNWFPNMDAQLSRAELSAKVQQTFPGASETARNAFVDTLMRFDNGWAGGNGNQMLSTQEIKSAILVISLLMKADFSNGLPFVDVQGLIPENLTVIQIESKLNQQLFARYGQSSYRDIPAEDLRLETMRLGMRGVLAASVVLSQGLGNLLVPSRQGIAVEDFTGLTMQDLAGESTELSPMLIELYDNKSFFGDGDGNLNMLEFFMLVTDLEFAHAYNQVTRIIAPVSVGTLAAVFPEVGAKLFSSEDFPSMYRRAWNNVTDFDTKTLLGGNSDGVINDTERAVMFAYVRILEMIFESYDVPKDGKKDGLISRDEARPILKMLHLDSDDRMLDGFFGNLGLEEASRDEDPNLWSKIRWVFKKPLPKTSLDPSEFFVRMMKILPSRLMHPTPDPVDDNGHKKH